MKILIATTNQGKFTEFTSQFSDFKFEFVNLKDVGLGEIDLD
jgi:inosine/xanthosine triphosphate pyrophosphatase family protein